MSDTEGEAGQGEAFDLDSIEDAVLSEANEAEDEDDDESGEAGESRDSERRRRRRGRRGGRRRRNQDQPQEGSVAAIADDMEPPAAPEPLLSEASAVEIEAAPAEITARESAQAESATVREAVADLGTDPEAGSPRRRSTIREKVSFFGGNNGNEPSHAEPAAEPMAFAPQPAQADPAASASDAQAAASDQPAQPRRSGWWSRR